LEKYERRLEKYWQYFFVPTLGTFLGVGGGKGAGLGAGFAAKCTTRNFLQTKHLSVLGAELQSF
jgi:hypothetical protein